MFCERPLGFNVGADVKMGLNVTVSSGPAGTREPSGLGVAFKLTSSVADGANVKGLYELDGPGVPRGSPKAVFNVGASVVPPVLPPETTVGP